MGDRLGRSEKTVPKSRSNHFQQARGNGRTQAIVHARDAGFGSNIVR
jgi:DNA-binding NarL/FixJ family response regulator